MAQEWRLLFSFQSSSAMDTPVIKAVQALHQAAGKCALAVTGGGVKGVADLLGVPGGSRTILEVAIPYDEQATAAYLGARPENYCSASTAESLATRAFERAAWLAPGATVIGLGCTASLATDRPKRGDHHAHLACRTPTRMAVWSLQFQKGARSRTAEDEIVSHLLLNALAWAFEVPIRLDLSLLPGEEVKTSEHAPDVLARFWQGAIPALVVGVDGKMDDRLPERPVLLPGAYNPVHSGHWGLAGVARRRVGQPVMFEISVRNVDKPLLSPAEVRRRLGQFAWHSPVLLTQAPTFVEKAALCPGAVFVIGADTAARLAAPRYYGGSEAAMLAALARMREQGCRCLMACRRDENGKVMRLADVAIPPAFRGMFEEIPASEFLEAVSSTALRATS